MQICNEMHNVLSDLYSFGKIFSDVCLFIFRYVSDEKSFQRCFLATVFQIRSGYFNIFRCVQKFLFIFRYVSDAKSFQRCFPATDFQIRSGYFKTFSDWSSQENIFRLVSSLTTYNQIGTTFSDWFADWSSAGNGSPSLLKDGMAWELGGGVLWGERRAYYGLWGSTRCAEVFQKK